MKILWILMCHDMRFQMRQRADWAALILFFVIVLVLLPFALGPDAILLSRLAGGLIWIAALLMCLLAMDRLFVADARDSTLDIMLLSPHPLPVIVLARLLAHSAMLLGALTLIMLPAALMLGLDLAVLPVMWGSLMLGVPCLILLGGMMAAITIALHRSPALLTLLLVPFTIPILIFGVAAVDAAALGVSAMTPLLLLGAMLTALLPASALVIAAALRQGTG